MKKAIFFLLFGFIIELFAKELPWESGLIQGELKNGFKYTVLHNPKPKNRAELKLLIKVGSLEEEDDQQGVAHFIEHMAFNGSKHFKKNELISYLESIGVKFGHDLNANTSYERTLYLLTIPLEKENLQKSFLIFSDWASGLDFNPKELDKERGVILEEERLRNNLNLRLFHQYKDLLYKNSPYLEREPIGKKEIIKTVPLQRVKDFYNTWYRPELMHFIAVGDFNTTKIEALIKKTFSGLKNRNHKPRAPRFIPKNSETRTKTVWDSELTSNYLALYFMDELYGVRTEKRFKESIIERLLAKLLHAKLQEQIEKANPKATVIQFVSDKINANRGYYSFFARYRGEDELPALKELYSILWSFNQYGFSKDALRRVKDALLAENEKFYKRRYDQKSSSLSNQLLQSIIGKIIFVDYKVRYNLNKKLINSITVNDVNQLFRKIIHFKDRIILFKNNKGTSYTKKEILETIEEAKKEIHNPNQEKKLPKNLYISTLKPKKIIKKEYNKKSDIHHFTLENGIKIAFKQSPFTKNKIFLKGFSFGGESLYDASDLANVKRASMFVSASGAGAFSMLDLKKILSNTNLTLYTSIKKRTEEINGKSNIQDIENLFALLYLKVTQSKIDKHVTANIKKILKNRAKKALNNPKERFYREMKKFYYKDNPRIQFETPERIDNLNEDKMLNIFNDRFSDFNNFTFVIVGDISLKKVEELSQKYLGNLPVLKRKEYFTPRILPYHKGHQTFVRAYNHENISHISLEYKSTVAYSEKRQLLSHALKQILTIRLRNLIREEQSAVYSINAYISLDMLEVKSKATIHFSCNPKRKEEVLKMVYQLIDEIKTKPVTQKELDVYKKTALIHYETQLKENSFWIRAMESFYKKEIPLENIYMLPTLIKEITPLEILTLANELFSEDNIQKELNPLVESNKKASL